MDYEKKYKEAQKWIESIYSELSHEQQMEAEAFFPELKESDDEKIRKRIIHALHGDVLDMEETTKAISWLEKQGEPQDKGEISDGYHTFNELYYYRMLYNAAFFNMLPKEWVHKSKKHHDGEDCFGGGWFIVMANLPTGQISNHYELKDWNLFQIPEKERADKWDGHTPQEAAERLHKFLLEKQGEHKLTDKIEPKFHEGEWVVISTSGGEKVVQIDSIEHFKSGEPMYITSEGRWFGNGTKAHLWTIQDAKDGDVLIDKSNIECPFIFKETKPSNIKTECLNPLTVLGYCGIGGAGFTKGIGWGDTANCIYYPATKEQRDILFAKMKEAGYEWNADKKELKKIEQKPTNENPTDVGHEYYSELLNNDDSDTIDEYAYQCAYCMSHDWMKETATWEDVQKAVKLGAEWQKHKSTWSEEDKNFMYDTLSNLTELKDRYGKDYGNVGKCMDWLKSLKQRIGGEV